MNDPGVAIERAAVESYGRLLAFLAARSHDVAAAEDALADAFHSALASWPRDGVPQKPEAWLLTAARRRLLDRFRHSRVEAEAAPELLAAANEAQCMTLTDSVFPDERLKLLFICAHPAIDPAARTPLMLQTVLGMDAARIASSFLVKPATMGQRLSRAKAKIRDAGIPFRVPDKPELPARLDAVLEAIYAAYGVGWDDVAGADARGRRRASEAIELGRLLVHLMPEEPEALGLLALMLYCESRRDARRTEAGEYVPLSGQDITRWSRPMIDEADGLLRAAGAFSRIGRFQLEAAIQCVHAQRVRGITPDWEAIALMYEGLVQMAPAVGALVGRAAAVMEARDAGTAWELLQTVPLEAVRTYQPYWALAAHLLQRMGREAEAGEAYANAIGLCDDPAMRAFLIRASQGIPG